VAGGGSHRGTDATIRVTTGRRWLGGRRLPQCKLEAELRDAHLCGGDAVDKEGGVCGATEGEERGRSRRWHRGASGGLERKNSGGATPPPPPPLPPPPPRPRAPRPRATLTAMCGRASCARSPTAHRRVGSWCGDNTASGGARRPHPLRAGVAEADVTTKTAAHSAPTRPLFESSQMTSPTRPAKPDSGQRGFASSWPFVAASTCTHDPVNAAPRRSRDTNFILLLIRVDFFTEGASAANSPGACHLRTMVRRSV